MRSFTAVDPAEPMLQVARRRADGAGFADRIRWIVGHLDDVPYGPAHDAAVMLLVSHFVPTGGAKEALFAGIATRLIPGAPLVFADAASTVEPDPTEAAVRRAMAEDLGLDRRAAELMIENMWRRLHPVERPGARRPARRHRIRGAATVLPAPRLPPLGHRRSPGKRPRIAGQMTANRQSDDRESST